MTEVDVGNAESRTENVLREMIGVEKNKMSHKKWRRLWKKERRRKFRQEKAKRMEQIEQEEKIASGLVTSEAIEAKTKQDEWQELLQEKRREKLHEEWLKREKQAMEDYEKKQTEEERRKQERLDQERRIKEEWEAQQKREQRQKERQERGAKNREENLNLALEKSGIIKSTNQDDEPWHNPLVTKNATTAGSYGTEKDPNNCSFYLKTGACRFGERCSRQHPRPESSQTLMIPNMFQDVRLTEVMLDEGDQDVALEFDEDELYANFKSFYSDVLSEFKDIGKVFQFKVCCNFEPHLRGNVYVQFRSEEDALNAFAKFNGRWYAGRQLSVQFSPVTKWKSAICGTFAKNRCPRGKNCNFLHVFRNPNSEFRDADRDFEPTPSRPASSRYSEREWRSSTREMERRWERAESYHSERSRNDRVRMTSRSSTRQSRSRMRSRSRSRGRHRSRSRSDSRERSAPRFDPRNSYRRSSHRKRSKSRDRSRSRERRSYRQRSKSPTERKRNRVSKKRERSPSNSSSDSYENSPERDHKNRPRHSLKRNDRRLSNLRTSRRDDSDEFVPEFDSD